MLILILAGAIQAESPSKPHDAGQVRRVVKRQILHRLGGQPGRGLIGLVNQEPGWLYEGNAVLHPRGSEYQTQFVLDGVPLTENRSPGFSVQTPAAEVQSMTIWTAGFPSQYGRKMGGVIALDTAQPFEPGLHGAVQLNGGSFDTAEGYAGAGYGWTHNQLNVAASGSHTDWFLNPPVTQNYTNAGTTDGFSGNWEALPTVNDTLRFSVRNTAERFLVPNEQVQQAAGQRQDHDALETMGTASWAHILAPDWRSDVHFMLRDDTAHLSSNAQSTPIIAEQHRGFRESYLNAILSGTHFSGGAEADFIDIHEQFADQITDPSQFDDGTPGSFAFAQRGSDREQGLWAEEVVHPGLWNLAAGVRLDHYRLLVDQTAVSPRLSAARYFPAAGLLVHASYDRIFTTPTFENILLSSSPAVSALNSDFLRLPVQPSHGNDYEVGVEKQAVRDITVDVNGYVRTANNYADDDQLLDTTVSFPIAFRKSRIYGAESKVLIGWWHDASGFVSYSYMVGSAYLPVTGGLFLGDDADTALSQRSGRFWDSQDQRNTLRTRWTYTFKRAWLGGGAEYGSGLPTEFDGNQAQAIAQYGAQLVARVNLNRDRVRPALSVDASAGIHLPHAVELQVDSANLNGRINLIDFAGLFSGNAVGPPRAWHSRLVWSF